MDRMRKSRLSQAKQNRLMEHFVAGTTARCVFGDLKLYGSTGFLLTYSGAIDRVAVWGDIFCSQTDHVTSP